MGFTSWLRSRKRHGSPRKQPTFQPTLEALEGRWLPSTLTVLNNHDSGAGSLRADIAAANSGDRIVFAKSVHAITLTSGELALNKNLDIEGPGAEKLTVSGNNASRVFDVSNNATVTIAGLTIANGSVVDASGGGIVNEGGATLHLIGDTVANNTALGTGGGLWNQIGATVTISDSTFVGNKSLGSLTFSYPPEGFVLGTGPAEGGAIETDGAAIVSNSTFTDNLAAGVTGSDGTGGLGHGGAIGTNGPLTVTGCTFTDNQARGGDGNAGGPSTNGGSGGQAEGGAINIDGATTVADVSHSVFANNQSLGGAGGAGGSGGDGGTGGVGAGGAISQADATFTLEHSTFVGNEATGGTGGDGGAGGAGGDGGIGRGGAFVHTVTFGASTPLSNLSDVTMGDNRATGGTGGVGGAGGVGGNGGNGQGGAIRALLGTLNVSHSLLLDNQATGGAGGAAGAGGSSGGTGGNGQGGALFTTFGVKAVLSDTALLLNQAEGGDGAAGGNGGNGQGGGIFNDGPSPFGAPDLTLVGCQVAFNQADGGAAGAGGSDGLGVGGGIYNLGTLHLVRTEIVLNHASTSNDDIFP